MLNLRALARSWLPGRRPVPTRRPAPTPALATVHAPAQEPQEPALPQEDLEAVWIRQACEMAQRAAERAIHNAISDLDPDALEALEALANHMEPADVRR